MAAAVAKPVEKAAKTARQSDSRATFLTEASGELFFGVVGHVGSGTSTIAAVLKEVLEDESIAGGKFDTTILKARNEIETWAESKGYPLPKSKSPLHDLDYSTGLQDLGDSMRTETKDDAAVATAFVRRIRTTRAKMLNQENPKDGLPVVPDGQRRAYVLDSIRHPAEVHLLRRVYGPALAIVGVVCGDDVRENRLVEKYSNAGKVAARNFMDRDARGADSHGQRVTDAFHLSDYFVDNTEERTQENQANPHWVLPEDLGRLIRIMTRSTIERPTKAETAMHAAYGAQMRSSCLSRQVGAALMNASGAVISTGTNEPPRAGGGVWSESDEPTGLDGRCAFRGTLSDKKDYHCRNTREQNEIVDDLIKAITRLEVVKNEGQILLLKDDLRRSRIGELLEFSRAVHAEMEALLSAARIGVSTVGTTVFVTTFPCHYCARHLVAAGVDEVQYIEPYPKSRALKLHDDAITVKSKKWKRPSENKDSKVLFRPFRGVAPRFYKMAFLKDRELKDKETGQKTTGVPMWGEPWHVSRVSYVQLEAKLSSSGDETNE